MSDDLKNEYNKACETIGHIPTPPRPATILLDGQVVSNGVVHLEQGQTTLTFQPQDGKTLDTPILGAVLRLRDTQETIALADASPCPTGSQSHFHLHLAI